MTAPTTSVVFALAYQTWVDGVIRDFSWSPDRIAQHLLADPRNTSVVVADPLRSHLARLRHHAATDDAEFPSNASRTFVQPRRWRRHDSPRAASTRRAYARLDRWLRTRAPQNGVQPVLVSCHPVLASVADRSAWSDVVYYGWDDWASYPPFRRERAMLAESYADMAARDVNVIGVTQTIVDRVGAARGAVVPNGITAADFERLGAVPAWFSELPGPVALYAGSLEGRVDVAALERCAHDLPSWTFVLVGHMHTPGRFEGLAALPNVRIRDPEPRPSILAMMGAAQVCLVPHQPTAMAKAMSPLKLYEYLGAGSSVVATDLPPMRGVSDRCLLVPPGVPIAPAVAAAGALPRATAEQIAQFRATHDWSQRYRSWRLAALGA